MPKAPKKYKRPSGQHYIYIRDPWVYDHRATEERRINLMLAWVCVMVRDLCKLQMDHVSMTLYDKGTSNDVIVELRAPSGVPSSTFEAVLGGHHPRDFVLDGENHDDEQRSIVYRYDYEKYNAPPLKGWMDHNSQRVDFNKLPDWFPVRRGGTYPRPRPVPRMLRGRAEDVATLPGRLIEGDPECVPYQPPPAAPLDEPASAPHGQPPMDVSAVDDFLLSIPLQNNDNDPRETLPRLMSSPPPIPQSQHAFEPYESMLPTSSKPHRPRASPSSERPRATKLGKIDPDDEDAQARAMLTADRISPVPTKSEPIDAFVKAEPMPGVIPPQTREREVSEEELAATAKAAMAAMAARQAALKAGEEVKPAIPPDVEERCVKAEPVEATVPLERWISAEEMNAIMAERRKTAVGAADPQAKAHVRIKTEDVDMQPTLFMHQPDSEKTPQNDPCVKREPASAEQHPPRTRVKGEPEDIAVPIAVPEGWTRPQSRFSSRTFDPFVDVGECSVSAVVKAEPAEDGLVGCDLSRTKQESPRHHRTLPRPRSNRQRRMSDPVAYGRSSGDTQPGPLTSFADGRRVKRERDEGEAGAAKRWKYDRK